MHIPMLKQAKFMVVNFKRVNCGGWRVLDATQVPKQNQFYIN
jgi:hypothetical protein